MMNCVIEFSVQAEDQLGRLYDYVSTETSPMVAKRYTDAIVESCEGMQTFPYRGTLRNDVRPALRVSNYKGSTVIAFAVNDAAKTGTILGIYYGGQDCEGVLQLGLDD